MKAMNWKSATAAYAVLFWAGMAVASASPGETCAATKQKATGLKAKAKLSCYSKYTKTGGSFDLATCLQKAETKFETAFQKAEFSGNGDPRGCATSGDAAAIESLVDDFVAAVVAALPAVPPPTPTSEPTSTPTPEPTSTPTLEPTSTPTDTVSLAGNGAACTASSQCASSHCVTDASHPAGKICCVAGCADSGAASCGETGTCTSNGLACTLYPFATTCGSPSCSGSTYTGASTCNGAGSCNSGSPSPCPNMLNCANAATCATSCTPGTTAGCAFPAVSICNAGGTACLLLSGQTCTADNQCASGHCTSATCE